MSPLYLLRIPYQGNRLMYKHNASGGDCSKWYEPVLDEYNDMLSMVGIVQGPILEGGCIQTGISSCHTPFQNLIALGT